MPRLSRWFARTALLHLVTALLLGAAMPFAAKHSAYLAAAWPVYIHLLVLGWATQLIAAVAFWMFPRADPKAAGNDAPGWAMYGLLNSGLLLRAFAEPVGGRHALLPLAAILQLAAIVVFAATLWPRIRGR
ncbi:MAG TPA: hypothetical protein VFT04_05940 [Gemmatimonadales bacterium]|nr:hypothetical protein [Gemmatimonadales bacterium]